MDAAPYAFTKMIDRYENYTAGGGKLQRRPENFYQLPCSCQQYHAMIL
jgi:hypothetical protein